MKALRMVPLLLGLSPWVGAQTVGEAELSYARVTAPRVQLRCFAGAKSPLYEDQLEAGAVVRVAEMFGDFRRVVLPLGVTGYVHKKFTEVVDGGMIEAVARNVSFRYRPKGSEAPAAMLQQGDTLYYLSDEGEWWRVRHPGAAAYLPSAALEVVEAAPAVEAAYARLDDAHRGVWRDAIEAQRAAEAAAAELAALRGQLDAVVARFQAAAAKPVGEQDFTAVQNELGQLVAALPEGSVERARAVGLQAEIEQQQLLARALRVVSTPVETVDVTPQLLPEETEDPLDRFDAVGWLRREKPFGGQQRFTLVKGGRLLYVMTCTSGRYDLALFDGVEVGVAGVKTQPDVSSVRYLDALKLEILKLDR